MSDMRQFLRYEIIGYMLFIDTFFLILPFINTSVITNWLPELLKISISGLIIAIPIGWLIYQISNIFLIKKQYRKKSIKLIKKWSENKGKTSLPDHYCGELVNVGLYFSNNNVENDENSFDSQLATETLRGYWTHLDARWIVAWPIPIISVALTVIILLSIPKWLVNSSIFHFDDYCFIVSFFILIIIMIISWSINRPLNRIIKEIDALESILILLRKNQIETTIDKIHEENLINF